jgi:hypothetical protein
MSYNTDIERLNYYEGEFLGAVDFQAEQEYHREMRRRHNLGQHTWGLVTGLDLAQAPNGNTNNNGTEVDVFLQPGMAVDGFGREIVLLNQVQLTAAMFAAYYNPSPTATPILIYVWIGYEESLLQPPADACTSMNVSNAYSRTEETYTLTVTANSTSPPDGAIVVDGAQMAIPAEPTSSSSPSPVTDPPDITLPYDDSVPFQEFSTDDTTLNWWLPLGRVSWDPYNEVFIQIDPASAAFGREYAGNVSAMVYAPAGMYAIADRSTPYPLPAGDGGVLAEVAGSLQVDRDLVIGGAFDSSITFPLTIFGTDTDQDLIEFRNSSGAVTWYVNQEFDGKTLGLNIGEVTTAGKNVDNRIFIQPTQTLSTLPSPLNVGIGTSTPRNPLAIRGQGSAWELLSFEDNGGNTVWHLNHNPQGFSSSAKSPGLNFCETGKADFRLFLQAGGNVGIGTVNPVASLDVAAGPIHVGQTTNPTLTAQGAYLGWNLSGDVGETDFINNRGLGPGGFVFINTPPSGSPPSTLMTISGAGNVSTTGSLFIGPAAGIQPIPAPGALIVNGSRTYMMGVDAANNHWIMAGGVAELLNNAICLNYDAGSNKGQVSLGSNWNLSAASKAGYVVDRFVSAKGEQLERGDVVVIHKNASGPMFGGSNRIPLIEVERTRTAKDPRVCGIVDEPNARSAALQDLDQNEAGKCTIGMMVTLGSYSHCKVDADIAPIAAGDLLTTSATEGHAQKLDLGAGTQPGIVIGKALGSLKKGKGLIPVLISHQ